MRRLAPVIYAVVFFDAFLMFAIVPVLPDYARELALSKAQSGIVIGIYSGIVLVAALPIGRLSDRLGARRLTIAGVVLLAVSTVLVGLSESFWMLLAARAGQGLSSAISWTAALAWLSADAGSSNRPRQMANAMSAGSLGVLMGPVVAGPLASALGIRAPFVIFAAVAALLAVGAALPAEVRGHGHVEVGLRDLFVMGARSRLLAAGAIVMLLVATVSGVIETLVPLSLGRDGYGSTQIALVLGVAGLVGVATNLTVGRIFNRFGGVPIGVAAIGLTVAGLVLMALPVAAAALSALFVLITIPISAQYAVSFPLAGEGAEQADLPSGAVLGAINVCWGLGFLVGPAVGSVIAQATADGVTYLLLTLLCVGVAVPLRRLALTPDECQPTV